MNYNLFILFFLIFMIMLALIIYRYLLFRAIKEVIRIFREKEALSAHYAKTRQELGLAPKGIMEKLFTFRDYRENAFKMLLKLEIIRHTRGDKFFLSEKELVSSNIMEKLGDS